MKKLLVIMFISSIFLTQCYTQKEYLTEDYNINESEELTKIVLVDGTEIELSGNQYSQEMNSDTLIIKRRMKEKFGDHTRIRTISDTLKIEEIHSLYVSVISPVAPILAGGIIGGFTALTMSGRDIFGTPIPWSERQSYVYLGVGLGALIMPMLYSVVR